MNKTKTSAPEGAASSSRRAQPVRQTRTNPPRTSSLNRTNSHPGGPGHEQPIEIFPAVTHFVDAITALPKELVRHFTLLKEVDAKIFAPKEELCTLIESLFEAQPSDLTRSIGDGSNSGASGSAQVGRVDNPSASGNAGFVAGPPAADAVSNAVFDPSNLNRRQRFRQTAFKISEMLNSLEEKNHVISTANDALDKQLARIEDLWPHLEGEFSDEAKWGSTTHWAYLENRVAKTNNTQAERSRREGAATLSAAAQQLAEEAAARSSDRKRAIADKKSSKGQATEADADGKTQEPSKKSQGSGKSRKSPADAAPPVGLGISSNTPVNGGSSSKRRKVESNKTNGSAPMERAISSALGSAATSQKTKGTASPRETPAPDAPSKKRKALPTSSNPAKKNRTSAAAPSPSIASSPIIPNFPDNSKTARTSPAPPNAPRPPSARARQNSTHGLGNTETARPRPSPALPAKTNGVPPGTPDLSTQGSAAKNNGDVKPTAKEPAPVSKPEPPKSEAEPKPPPAEPAAPTTSKKEAASKTTEDREMKKEWAAQIATPITVSTVTTKSGRASKPSTPALATFAEAASARTRVSRNAETAGTATTAKRSHKKGGSISAAAAVALAAQVAAVAEETRKAPDDEDEGEIDGDELRYCYCNNVSYGDMIGCDAPGCPREWFHLECVGLRVAPKGNAKWYCDDCKKRQKMPEKKVNGR